MWPLKSLPSIFELGQEALDQPVVQVEDVKNALSFFKEALSQQPNNDAALAEQRLARAYLAGRELYDNREWHQTVSALSEIYELNPLSGHHGNPMGRLYRQR